MKKEKLEKVLINPVDLAGLYQHINNMRPSSKRSWFNALLRRERDEDIQDFIESANIYIKAMADSIVSGDSKLLCKMSPVAVSVDDFINILKLR